MTCGGAGGEPRRRATQWISRGLEALDAEVGRAPEAAVFDVLIVGSGYGGAVAADRLAGACDAKSGRELRIAVLERGREYLRGAFPRSMAELAGHVRFTLPGGGRARGRLEGLFDLRIGPHLSVLVANGVGGGSLINAGVMLFPEPEVFGRAPWPASLDPADLERRAGRLLAELGAADAAGRERRIDDGAPLGFDPARRAALRRIDPAAHRSVPVTVALQAHQRSVAGVPLDACLGCGDCATGCNHGAKVSLDLGLLARAQARGVRIVAGATVSRMRRAADDPQQWELDVWHTDLALRRRMAGPVRLRARRVVLAAGTLGSTEILLRSRGASLQLSRRLGARFSGNGDMLAAIHACDEPMHAAGDEAIRPSLRQVGPTIVGTIDWRSSGAADARCLVQDLAVPAPLRRLFEELTATSAMLHRLPEADRSDHRPDDDGPDPCAVDPAEVERSTVVALIAHDAADGVITEELAADPGGMDAGIEVDPGVAIAWQDANADPRLDACHARLQAALERTIGGRLLPNPAWRLLPPAMERVLGTGRGPLVTVHPLGGCPIGADRDEGVVDALGRVFDADAARSADAVHDGLVVLDGSIVPTSLGVNPALTIATLADHAIERLMGAEQWNLRPAAAPALPPAPRPAFVVDTDTAVPAEPTRVGVVERLSGPIEVAGRTYFAELSLAYEPEAVGAPGARLRGRRLRVARDPGVSRLRIFAYAPPPKGIVPYDAAKDDRLAVEIHDRRDEDALVVAPIAGGTLQLLHREPSRRCARTRRALLAWLCNRGLRDVWQELSARLAGRAQGDLEIGERIRQMFALASRAGEVRRFDYRLDLGPAQVADDPLAAPFRSWRAPAAPVPLAGHKRIAYERRANPWNQLMQLDLTELGDLRLGAQRRIEVSLSYFARMQTPLLRLTHQRDLPSAWADLAAFGLHFGRMLLGIHLFTFRLPDEPLRPAHKPQRLPGALPGLPEPEVLRLDTGDAGAPLQLTVYPRPGAARPPVLMVHGYSASGTTFAHPALPCALASFLWRRGAEPWVVDLRSSCGLGQAHRPWAFEDMAWNDIPAALEEAWRRNGRRPVDVVSHCMGSAMFAMSLLGPQGQAVRARLRRWVMTQGSPALVFAPVNQLRAYVMQYLLNLLPSLTYRIGSDEAPARPAGTTGVGAGAFDRLLASLPYLDDAAGSEFDVENPPPARFTERTPWTRTRHRLDALFGRVFDSRRMASATLDRIDDFFGSINLRTVAQTIHFARSGFVCTADGRPLADGDAAARARFDDLPALGLFARGSGLVHWETGLALLEWLRSTGTGRHRMRIEFVGRGGHQDLLFGREANEVCERIDRFLAAEDADIDRR